MKIQSIILALTLLLSHSVFAQSWYEQSIWDREDRPYQWYPPELEQRKKQKNNPESAKPAEIQAFEQLQKELDESRKIAIMNATPENLKRYVALQELALGQAATFTEQWQRMLWENPQLDYSLQGRPTNTAGLQQYDSQRAQDIGLAIQEVAGSNGVMFFYRSDCSYCHAMAPVLRNFADQYGVKVMAVSMDGGPMAGFPDAQMDNGISAKLGVNTVPALFVADTKTKSFKPIGYGVISQSELETRFLTISKDVGSRY